jgi:cytochrome P450
VFKWEQYGHWCFSRFEDVNALLRDRRFERQILHVATRQELGWPEPPEHLRIFTDHESHSLLELEPPVHTRLRGLISRAFLSRQIERLRPFIVNLSNQLVDRLETRDEVDLLEEFATPVPVYVICELLGAPVEMSRQFLAWSHDHVAMYMAKRDRAIEDRAVKAVIAFSSYMRGLINERRKNLGSDLLSELIRAESEGQRLTEDELITTAILVLNAGHEATVHSMGNGIKTMLEQGVRGPVTPELIDEIMRFDPPLHMFTRYALEDLEFAGVNLKRARPWA